MRRLPPDLSLPEGFISRAMEHAGIGVCVCALDGTLTFMDEAAARMLGVTQGRVPADSEPRKSLSDLKLAAMPWDDVLSELGEHPHVFDIECPVKAVSGQVRWIVCDAHRVPDPAPEGAEVVLVFRDITGRRKAAASAIQSQSLRAIGQLASGIAHEITSPLQFIGNNTRFLQESFGKLIGVVGALPAFVKRSEAGTVDPVQLHELKGLMGRTDVPFMLDEVPSAIQETLRGVERVKDIARAARQLAHPAADEPKAVDINQTVQDALMLARHEWRYVAEVETHLDPHLPLVLGCPSELTQVMLNLVVNAAHAVAEALGSDRRRKGRIEITTSAERGRVTVRIEDSGKGIPEHVRHKIFDPFFTTKPAEQGTGQGLAISRAAVERCGGILTFEARDGEGSAFVVRLPVAKRSGTSAESSQPARGAP